MGCSGPVGSDGLTPCQRREKNLKDAAKARDLAGVAKHAALGLLEMTGIKSKDADPVERSGIKNADASKETGRSKIKVK